MNNFVKNPYFDTEELEKMQIAKPNDFISVKQYPVQEPEDAPKTEPVKGFTSIIIPCFFNSYPIFHMTGNCIGSIREHTDKEKTPYEIIMIQNGENGVEHFTEETFKNTYCEKVIPNKENLGFARAVNQGIRVSQGEYIAIVNNDVQVFEHWLEDMQEALQYVDLIQAQPMYGMPFARAIEAKQFRDLMIANERIKGTIEDSFDDFRDFSCVLTKKSLFARVGLFDEQFFCYGEDLDLVRRIEKIGGKVKSTKRVRTHHIISMTASGIAETPDIMNKSKELLKAKWGY